ncbi:MAG: enoyl-CoA hydratase/isomerase family protein [Candidatus Rokubacteria bacterium]|nr:enoyl-CoA hydratase/isomerase family protein [Candidatus Rokubacteria bacterium]
MADLTVAREGSLARVTLDRPPLNILTPALIAELGAAFRGLRGDPAVRVVVLAGAGRAFSAGVEVQAMRDLDPQTARTLIEGLHDAIRALEEVEAPVVARLHGHVLGGALELVMACDLRLAGASCRLGMPEITVGILSVIDAVLMPGLIGWGRAAELILTGEPVEAAVAERWGLVNRVVPDSALDREVEAWVGRLLALPPRALRLQVALLRRWRRRGLEPSVTLSMDAFATAYATDEPRRAMQGFLDRRREGRGAGETGG